MYIPRVSLPSRGGTTFVKVLDERIQSRLNQHVGKTNRATFALLAIAWTALLADSSVDGAKPARVINKFFEDFVDDPVGLIRRYSSLADDLLRSLRSDASPAEGTCSRPFLKEMVKTPIFREYHHFYLTGDPKTLQFILTFLLFGKKVSYVDTSLDQNAFRDWLKVEDRLGSLELPIFVDQLRPFLDAIFDCWEADVFLPKHGPGAVSEERVKGVFGKNRHVSVPPKVSVAYSREMFFPDETHVGLFPAQQGLSDAPYRSYSRLKFVPKDYNKTRSICMEPIAFQWAQQGVRLWYEKSIGTGVLSQHVHLKDQTANQRAATFGSKTHRVDTLDLSSASDSVAWKLVREIFPARVLKHLHATRTNRVETPGGKNVEIHKFAPMGSALCFPVQSTLYSAVLMYAAYCYRWGHRPGDLRLTKAEVLSQYDQVFRPRLSERVPDGDHRLDPFLSYGDDLICDSRITSTVVELLQRLGFSVNEGKSFVGSQDIRESCGIYAYKGVDITPLRFKVRTLTERISAEVMAGVIDLANRCYERGFFFTRRHLIQYILHCKVQGVPDDLRVNPVLFSNDPDETFCIKCDVPRNPHLQKRGFTVSDTVGKETSSRYQRSEVRSMSIGPLKVKRLTSYDDQYRYIQWWRSHYNDPENHPPKFWEIDRNVRSTSGGPLQSDTLRTGFRWRWTSA